LAVEEIEHNRVQVNGQPAKASREVRLGDTISLRQREQPTPRVVLVRGLSGVRGPAPVAQLLYEETPESSAARATWQAQRAYAIDPGAAQEQGRPTKQARRQLQDHQQAEWRRWSASIDDQ